MGQPASFFALWMYIPAALLAALGAIGLYCSLFKGRSKGRLRCPKCWYDMAGVYTPTRCPECGRAITTREDLLRTRRHWLSALISLALIAPLAVVFANLHARTVYYALMPKWKLVEEVEWNGSTISRYHVRNPDDFGERVLVRAGGNHLLDREDYAISLNGYNHSHETLLDVNGDGVSEVVIESFSGGAHCCYRVFIVELRATGPVIVADIDARNGMGLLGHSSTDILFNIPDQTFDYWKVSHVESPMPSVYYRLKDGSLRVALDELDQDPFTRDQLDALVERARKNAQAGGSQANPAALWHQALDMLYFGQDEQAWDLFDRAWTEPTGKAEFLAEFKDMLAKDPWYQDVVAARIARKLGQPIPPSIVGMSGTAADAQPH